ncbi:hypothetical protein CVT24_010102 [Panaeolus cyanescens]|uniref:Uncharacterized protein n=1 Tax=Panaeolus cyanescens TaxID=181874 RepID=A0A409W9H8_9AGAR|nr:hypothetical protein CVT24_010102 [Panaeolus cyanescens]
MGFEWFPTVLVSTLCLLFGQIACHVAVLFRVVPIIQSGELATAPNRQYLGCSIVVPGMQLTLLAWIPGMVVAVILFWMMMMRCPMVQAWRKRRPRDPISPLYKLFCFGGSSSFITVVDLSLRSIASTIVATALSITAPESPYFAALKPYELLIF